MKVHAHVQLDSEVKGIDISRFIEFNVFPEDLTQHGVMVQGMPGYGRRAGEVGIILASLSVKHSSGYAVVVEFPDGGIDVFAPMSLFPAELPQCFRERRLRESASNQEAA